jgi:hypothetical protein
MTTLPSDCTATLLALPTPANVANACPSRLKLGSSDPRMFAAASNRRGSSVSIVEKPVWIPYRYHRQNELNACNSRDKRATCSGNILSTDKQK